MLQRAAISVLREQGLTKKEAQHFHAFINDLPVTTLTQELSEAYNCTKEEAKNYIDEFILHSESYLEARDLDTGIISAVLTKNNELKSLCKQELQNEWKVENANEITKANEALQHAYEEKENVRKNITEIEEKYRKIEYELKEMQNQIRLKEKLASDVETKISEKIEAAKKDAADFISEMAFVLPVNNKAQKNEKIHSQMYTLRRLQIQNDGRAMIEDIDLFIESNLKKGL